MSSKEHQQVMARFMPKVEKTDSCWLWRGSMDAIGYGRMGPVLGENKAHRISWCLFRGSINGMKVLHTCDVRNCVNPDHLYLGTQFDNMRDCVERGRHKSVPQYGEDNPMARLSRREVDQMRTTRTATGRSYRLIGRDFGVSTMTAYRAIVGQSWRK